MGAIGFILGLIVLVIFLAGVAPTNRAAQVALVLILAFVGTVVMLIVMAVRQDPHFSMGALIFGFPAIMTSVTLIRRALASWTDRCRPALQSGETLACTGKVKYASAKEAHRQIANWRGPKRQPQGLQMPVVPQLAYRWRQE
jgi:hypothetical protein